MLGHADSHLSCHIVPESEKQEESGQILLNIFQPFHFGTVYYDGTIGESYSAEINDDVHSKEEHSIIYEDANVF